jgi:hypothetical protein
MKIKLTLIFAILITMLYGCSSEKEYVPQSFLGHVDIVLDTATVRALAADGFIRGEFSMVFYDTIIMVDQRSYDMYIIGTENFLHISEARGFYGTQEGGLNVIMQSKKPDMQDSLIAAWKKFTAFALEINPSKGQGYELFEVLPVIGWTNIQHPRIIPFLSTYSAESFKTWGYPDSVSNGLTMKTFMLSMAGPSVDYVLFRKIEELYISATTKEKDLLASALFAGGYEKEQDAYVHPASAKIIINVMENESMRRINKIKIKLNRSVPAFEKTYGRLKLTLNNDTGWIYFD